MEIEGYDTFEEMAQAILSDSVSPAICMNEDCNFTCEMEPDQDAGYCEECRTNSMPSAAKAARLRKPVSVHIEPVSGMPKRKSENGEQRLARQNHQSSPEIPEFAG
jgi:hypothetical protein